MIYKTLVLFCLGFLLVFSLMLPVSADNDLKTAKLFEVHCAGCHPNGGNIIRRGKTLKQKALQRNKMDSLTAINDIITNGKNNMSAFGDRLSPSEIEALSLYVLRQAENDWK